MLRSLWSGVSGMQAHQVALDVESNNIANVNTNGFKYARADFSTMISQTKRAATIPYAGYGGVNNYSVGLGTGIETTTKVFEQGSLQNTDRKGDLALSGQGLFVVSNNGGYSNMYTRDGAFMFDAVGNFVNTSGFIVQGWVRDLSKLGCACGGDALNRVDSTGPVGNITIDPRLTIPARKTSVVTGNINLTSGNKTENITCPSPLDSSGSNNYIAGGLDRVYDTSDKQHEIPKDMGVMFNESGEALRLQEGQGVWISYQTATSRPIDIGNNLGNGPISTTVTINGETITWTNDTTANGTNHLLAAQRAINNFKDKTGVEAIIENNRLILQNKNQTDGSEKTKNIDASGFDNGIFNGGGFVQGAPGDSTSTKVTTAFRYEYNQQTTPNLDAGKFRTTEDLRAIMQADANRVKIFGGDSGAYQRAASNGATNAANGPGRIPDSGSQLAPTRGPNNIGFNNSAYGVKVTLNSLGQFEIMNKDDGHKADSANSTGVIGDAAFDSLNIFVSAFHDANTSSNVLFKNQMKAMNTGVLVEGGQVTTTSGLRMATFAQTIDIYDSLGNKHEFTMQFQKEGTSEWSFRIIVPEPAELIGSTAQRTNILEGGSITFGENGELLGVNPSTIQFKPNSGASSPQNIELNFGKGGGFDGITSTARESQAQKVNGDGYASGVLKEYYFDKTGTMIGSFDNGVHLALAQVAVATFANYEGLQESGSNLYAESANSGQATIGTAGTGGRADIAASKLEMSNADLSRGLTQLIVVQRGFQANSKSVTTADQILNTLLGLKQ
ncbi:flagellar hook protein FlgE [Helicobacter sp. MIT 11-5569]|uniref:flagellar hook protein FlgE n=1 Tax=Helicobacter sp. MIT 11-5569 TaxID=1548151 RepID=UPI00051FDB55|nr:flagellar hook protein FlgE [Helicobacter sp. MIT 11-5569]TLD84556.1 flagellar hook protein FlgE [Helicobacter sp. MIT 11-5569]